MGQRVSVQHKARAQHSGYLLLSPALSHPAICPPAPDSDDHRVGGARPPAQAEGSGCCEQEGAAEHL